MVKGAPGRNVAETQTTPDWVSGWQKNVALAGNFAPVATELTWRGLPVEGRLPSAIDGVWMRNGPNPRFEPEPGSLYHWFGALFAVAHFLFGHLHASEWVRRSCAVAACLCD